MKPGTTASAQFVVVGSPKRAGAQARRVVVVIASTVVAGTVIASTVVAGTVIAGARALVSSVLSDRINDRATAQSNYSTYSSAEFNQSRDIVPTVVQMTNWKTLGMDNISYAATIMYYAYSLQQLFGYKLQSPVTNFIL